MDSVFLEYDLVIIGGGPAGMSCAISASENKVEKILLIEREEILGGELNQSIHCSFGKDIFGYSVTGSEYIQLEQLKDLSILKDIYLAKK